jgi:hypothetical protein
MTDRYRVFLRQWEFRTVKTRWIRLYLGAVFTAGLAVGTQAAKLAASDTLATDLSQTLNRENAELKIELKPVDLVDDMAYLRRVSVDLIGRIPSHDEIQEYMAWPAGERRSRIVDKLMSDPRFVDRWTTFFADMLRLRSNSPGGAAALAFVHQALQNDMPYDELAKRFISANGKAGAVPEVAYVLGDNADPMALAGATAQVFMGLRISCAQCHDHPFDKWTRQDFYDFTNTVYTQEVNANSVLWPPQGDAPDSERKPVDPKFLVGLIEASATPDFIARLDGKRQTEAELAEAALAATEKADSIDDLLLDAADKAVKASKGRGKSSFDIAAEAKKDREAIDLDAAMNKASESRTALADLIASPRNRYFARCFVNRVWADLVGRGFVEPIDDFSDSNPPTHPQTLDFLANEFVAGGFQFKPLIKMVVTSEPYQRGQAVGLPELDQEELRAAFLAAPARRMLSEVMYDSIITAGHLFEYKHPQGANMKTVTDRIRVAVPREGEELAAAPLDLAATAGQSAAMKPQMAAQPEMRRPGYNLESGIELDFDAVLRKAQEEATEAVQVEKMAVKSAEELEAERMLTDTSNRRRFRYVYQTVERTFDDNPMFGSSFRMASPANPEHFIRIFGQTDRTQVGITRDHAPSMRQALMMLNGKMTHEASRVGPFEPMHKLLTGETPQIDQAIELAYLEILTRKPQADEVALAKSIVADGESPLEGMADLRWVLLNSNEFRYLP